MVTVKRPKWVKPGEQWTSGETEAQHLAKVGKTKPPEIPGAGVGAGAGAGFPLVTEDTKYKDLVLKALEGYLATVSGQKPWQELYTEKAEALGIPGMTKKVTGITQQVLDVEGLLDKLEGDIESRTKGLLVTGAQQRRQLATEGTPLREQMADLMRAEARAGAGLTGARGELATMMGLEEKERARTKELGLGMLPHAKEALTYESPEEKFARLLKEEEEKKKAGVSPYMPKEPTYPTSYREWELAGKPGTYEEWVKKGGKTVEDVKKSILSNINSAIDQYKLNPEGFRERYIESLVATYGEDYRDYVNKQVYSLMPDTKEGAVDEAKQLKEAKASMKAQLMTVRGTDGYISPEDYKKASNAWHQKGLSKRKFDEYFEMFVNPLHPEDYGVSY